MSTTDVNKVGIVKRVSGGKAEVKVACSADECSGCKASFLCSTNKDAVSLEAVVPEGRKVEPGDRVRLVGRLRGWFAGWMLLAGFPCLAILLGVCAGFYFQWSDVVTGLVALGALVAYFAVLLPFKDKVNRRVVWEIA